jgi:regulator of chromosome condensation
MDSYQLGLPLDHPAMANIVAARTTKGNGNKPLSEEYIPIPVPLLFPPPPTLENLLPPVPPYADVPDPYQHPSLDPIVSISAGTRHNLAVSRSGNIYSWGYGNQCQLGLTAETEFAVVPTRVRSKQLNGYLVKDASAGGQHCFCVATMPA